jgi:hypothetical protein
MAAFTRLLRASAAPAAFGSALYASAAVAAADEGVVPGRTSSGDKVSKPERERERREMMGGCA